jgi:hypothetical protein
MEPWRYRSTLTFALMSLAALAGCDDDTPEPEEAGSTSSSSTSSSTTTSSTGSGCTVATTVLDTDGTAECIGDQCAEEGGLLREDCINAMGPPLAHCYPPQPAPTATEFVCDGLFNCPVGEVCVIMDPYADGCTTRDCRAPIAACEADPSCACLEAEVPGLTSNGGSCSEDADGNVTATTTSGWPEG